MARKKLVAGFDKEILKVAKGSDKIANHIYWNIYVKFILDSHKQNSVKKPFYTEKHHVLPKSKNFWPEHEFNSANIVELSFLQHMIAHGLLEKALGNTMEGVVKRMFSAAKNPKNEGRFESCKFGLEGVYSMIESLLKTA